MHLEAIDWVGIALVVVVVGFVIYKILNRKNSSGGCGCGGSSGKCKGKKAKF